MLQEKIFLVLQCELCLQTGSFNISTGGREVFRSFVGLFFNATR